MTRHEDGGPIDREELKKEIREELKADERSRRLKWMLAMLLIMVALLVAPFVVTGVIVAKTGLVQVPVLSALLYDPVMPSRTVTPLVGSTPEAVLNAAVTRAEYNSNFGTLKLYLTEKELTTVLNSAISNEEVTDTPLPLKSGQAILTDGQIEIYVLTERDDGRSVPILMNVSPDVQNGRLVTTQSEITIGSLKVPNFAAHSLVQSMTSGLSNAINDALSEGGQLEMIKVTDGRVEIILITNN